MNFQFNNLTYNFNRYPQTRNKSLRAWSSAEENVLKYLTEEELNFKSSIIINDRFGFLSVCLNEKTHDILINSRSQEKAVQRNFELNNCEFDEDKYVYPLDKSERKYDLVIMIIPKSMQLFDLYLNKAHSVLTDNGKVICGFMTKHFSKSILETSSQYFININQSLAYKKSRLLLLDKKKKTDEKNFINVIQNKYIDSFRQYYGVFSGNHIDFATEFLLDNFKLESDENVILDMASGSGIIGKVINEQNESRKIHLIDDDYLAVESSKLNFSKNEDVHYHYNDNLNEFDNNYFDLIISNPPSHFGHENNIEISIKLFKNAKRCLKENGRMVLVSSKHLNFQTHLKKLFTKVLVLKENEKFIIYECKEKIAK